MEWANRNPYYHALLRIEMARGKRNVADQSTFLREAGDFIMKASKIEQDMRRIAVAGAPAIAAAQLWNYETGD
jgi:hypothetical protein